MAFNYFFESVVKQDVYPHGFSNARKRDLQNHIVGWGLAYPLGVGISDQMARISAPIIIGKYRDGMQIETGASHSAIIEPNGSLWMCGQNGPGALGSTSFTPWTAYYTFMRCGTDNDWKKISLGSSNSIAVKTDGTLWVTGQNSSGCFGLGDNDNRVSFTQVGTDTDWVDACIGMGSAFALKSDNTLWACGNNANGQLGIGNNTTRNTFAQVPGNDWVQVEYFNDTSVARKTDGSIWGWGDNANYSVGCLETDSGFNTPQRIVTSDGYAFYDWVDIQIVQGTGYGLRADGSAWAWGLNTYGQLGVGPMPEKQLGAVQIPSSTPWKSLHSGYRYCVGIKTDGTAWAWGDNSENSLGLGNDAGDKVYYPTQIQFPPYGWGYVANKMSINIGIISGQVRIFDEA